MKTRVTLGRGRWPLGWPEGLVGEYRKGYTRHTIYENTRIKHIAFCTNFKVTHKALHTISRSKFGGNIAT